MATTTPSSTSPGSLARRRTPSIRGAKQRLHILEVQRLIQVHARRSSSAWSAVGQQVADTAFTPWVDRSLAESTGIPCPIPLDRYRCWELRRRIWQRLSGTAGWAEICSRDLLSRPGVQRRRRFPHGHGQRVNTSCRTRIDGAPMGKGNKRQKPNGATHGEVFTQRDIDDGLVGQQIFAGEATRLAYGTDEAHGRPRPFSRSASPDWSNSPLALLIASACHDEAVRRMPRRRIRGNRRHVAGTKRGRARWSAGFSVGTGISGSAFALGTMMLGTQGNTDHDESIRMIHTALDAGINFVDTADVYSRRRVLRRDRRKGTLRTFATKWYSPVRPSSR